MSGQWAGGAEHSAHAADPAETQHTQAARVALPGLRGRPLRILHVSDSHIDKGTDLGFESNSMNFGEAMHLEYAGGKPNRATGEVVDCSTALRNILAAAAAQSPPPDLVVHTGNLVNYPSFRAVMHAAGLLEESGIPFAYTAGNEDWAWKELAGAASPQHFRRMYCYAPDATLSPLFEMHGDGMSPSHWLVPTGELPKEGGGDGGGPADIRVVGIDNSTGTVEAAQLEFFNAQAAAARAAAAPLVLCLHYPLHCAELVAALKQAGCEGEPELCGAAPAGGGRGGGTGGGGAAAATRGRHCVDDATAAFLAAAAACPELVAVLAGHVRAAASAPFGSHSCVQYTTDASCFGGYRLLDFSAAARAVL
eukprot:SAG22_NODE_63_length_23302_cov_17.506551_4_plen_365_part_00